MTFNLPMLLKTLPWKESFKTTAWGLSFWVGFAVLSLVLEFLVNTAVFVAHARGWLQPLLPVFVAFSLLTVFVVPVLLTMLFGRWAKHISPVMLGFALFPMVWNLSQALAQAAFKAEILFHTFGWNGALSILAILLPPMWLSGVALVMQALSVWAVVVVVDKMNAAKQACQTVTASKA